jgi:soluble lytic murein transglycosylase-like protein
MTTDEIKQLVAQYASYCGIDPGVALAQAQRESGFRQDVIFGPTESADGLGCRGLMQFCKGTWAQYGAGSFDNAFDIYANLDAWCALMQALLSQFGGDMKSALMAYNGGPKWVLQGTPSVMAQKYASAILAQAPTMPIPDITGATVASNGGGGGDGSGNGGGGVSVAPWLIIAAVGLVVVFMARD